MRKAVLTLTLSGLLLTSAAWAGPEGGTVVSGSATITNGAGGTTIRQATDRAIINWNRFNINPGQFVRFLQPSASSAILNRVTGLSPSYLMGELSATGRVFLVNPSGIVFGPSATVNVGSLFATTMQINDQDFMSGNYVFSPTGSASFVVNQGAISAADGGYVVLMAPTVENQGTIVARLGTVTLAAVPQTTVTFDGTGLVHYVVAEVPADDVLMPGDLVSDVIGGLVPTSSTDAAGVELVDGQVRLVGAGGMAVNSGRIEADSVELRGDRVGLFGAGTVEASRVLLSADSFAYTSPDSLIAAPGGRVDVLGGETLAVNGAILIGDNGFVETSAPEVSITQAPTVGTGSTWLIDPNNLFITDIELPTGTTPNSPFTTLGNNAGITPATIETALEMGGTVIVRTGNAAPDNQLGDIFVLDPIDPQMPGPGNSVSTLHLQAHRHIVVQADIGGTVPLNVILEANFQGTTLDGRPEIRGGDIFTLGGDFTATGNGILLLTGRVVDTAGGNFTVNGANGDLVMNGAVTAGAGGLSLQTGGNVMAQNLEGGNLDVDAGGDLNLFTDVDSANLDTTGNVSLNNTGALAVIVGQTAAPNQIDLSAGGGVTGSVAGNNLVVTGGGDVVLDTQVNSLTAQSSGAVAITEGDGDLTVNGIDANLVAVSVPGDLTVRDINSAGLVSLESGGNLSGIGGQPFNVTAGGTTTLDAGGVIGSPTNEFRVNVTGGLGLVIEGLVTSYSGYLAGSVTQEILLVNQPPGDVFFNGVRIGGPIIPVPPDPPPVPPVPPAPPVVPPVPPPDPDPDPISEIREQVDSAQGSGVQQINNIVPPAGTTGTTGTPATAPPAATSPSLVSNPTPTATGPNLQIGFTSEMTDYTPPQEGDADRFVMAALLQASVNAPLSYLNQLEDLEAPMTRTDLALYLGAVVGRPIALSGDVAINLEELLRTLFEIYAIDAGPNGLVARAQELGLLPAGLDPNAPLTRGIIYQILDSAFYNLKLADGRTVYQASFDQTPPQVSIANYPAVCGALSITLNGTVEPGIVLLQVGYKDSDVVKPNADGSWTTTVPLEPGMNTITVQAHDAAGNVTTRKLEVLCTVGQS